MAGGMSKRPGIPLGQRTSSPITQLHGSVEGLRRPPAPDPMAVIEAPGARAANEVSPDQAAAYRQAEPQHVNVIHPDAADGHVPGLLLEWRRPAGSGWEARVVYAELIDGTWVTCGGWLPAERVEPLD